MWKFTQIKINNRKLKRNKKEIEIYNVKGWEITNTIKIIKQKAPTHK